MSTDSSDPTWQDGHTWVDGGASGEPAPPGRAPERYELREVLGRGGSGQVWSAWDRELQREVAYKELHLAPNGPAAQRFLREARLTASLEHPGIVPVHDAGRRPDGGLYYVMQVIRGRSLDQVIKACVDTSERMALVDALVDACQAVAYAHEHGIVHRDIKPQNIMIGSLGEVRVVDWGLARHVDPDDSETSRIGAVVGSPRYMSPEQAAGRPVDARTDVWALGTVLHELLTGRPRVEGDSSMDLVARIARGDVPRVDAMDGPPELVAIAARALAVDPEGRYPHAGELLADLRAWRTGRRVGAYRYSPAEELTRLVRRYRWPLTGLAAGLLVAGMVAVDGVRRTRAERDRAKEAEQVARQAEADALDARAEVARALQDAYLGEAQQALEDDDPVGALVRAAAALELGPDPRPRAFAAHLLDQVPYRWADTETELPGRCIAVIPWDDGSWICRSFGGLWRFDDAGAVQIESRRIQHAQPTDDGRWLALAGPEGWWRVVDPVTGEDAFSSDSGGPGTPMVIRPDGSAVVAEVRVVSRVDLRSGEVRWTRRVPSLVGRVAWPGDSVYVSQANGVVDVLDAETGAPRGSWPKVAPGGAWNGVFSRDGQRLLYATLGGAVGVLHADGARTVLRSHGRRGQLGWSRDEGAVWVSDGDGIAVWTPEGEPLSRLPTANGDRVQVAMREAGAAHVTLDGSLRALEVVEVARRRERTLPATPVTCLAEADGAILCSLADWRLVRIDPLTLEVRSAWRGEVGSHALCLTSGGLLGTGGGRVLRFTEGGEPEEVVQSGADYLLALECGDDGRWATAAGTDVWFGRDARSRKVELDEEADRIVAWGEEWLVRSGRAWSRWSAEGRRLGPLELEARDLIAARPSAGKAVARGRGGLQVVDLRGGAPPVEIEGPRERGPVIWLDDRLVAVADGLGVRLVDVTDGSVRMHVDDHKGTIAMLHLAQVPGRGPLLLAGDHELRLFGWDLSVLERSDEELVAEIGRVTGLRVEGAGLTWVER